MNVQKLKLSEIVESSTNPREDFDRAKLLELGTDIKERGLDQPVVVRARHGAKGYELVIGARRFQASALLELPTIDAIVREMTDLEAETAQVVENEKREDLTPLERARGYQGLMTRHRLTEEEVALKVGKARSTVYAVVSLLKLEEAPKKAMLDGTISASTAMLLANLPPDRQVSANNEIRSGGGWSDGKQSPMTTRQARLHLQQHYFLDLRQAPFDTKDEQLLAGAGSCVVCPKRSDCQKDLFDQAKKATPYCLDSGCWGEKARLAAEQEAKVRGVELLPERMGAAIFSAYGDVDGAQGYILKSSPHPADAKGRKYSELLTPEQVKDLSVLAVNPKNELVELLKTDGLKEAVELTGKLQKREASKKAASSRTSAAQKAKTAKTKEQIQADVDKAAAEKKLREKVFFATAKAVVAAAEKRGPTDKALLKAMIQETWKSCDSIADRRQLPKMGYQISDAHFKKHFASFSATQLFGLLFDVVFDHMLGDPSYGDSLHMAKPVLKLLGINAKKIEVQTRAELWAEAKKKANPNIKFDAAGNILQLKKKPKAKKPSKAKASKPAKKKAA